MRPSITPLEIRKHTFAKRMHGYDVSEVNQFLEGIAEDLEEFFRSLDELERENTRLKEENARHRENDSALKETLLMAQRSAESVRQSAEKDAQRALKDAERQADLLMQQAMGRAADVEKRIRELRLERRNFHLKLQGTLDLFQQVMNFDRDDEESEGSVSIMHREKRREGEKA